MKITFLGTRHGITERDRFTSSILLSVGEKNYLIDAGAPIIKLLKERDVDFKSLGGIFITHSHPDHYIGLVEFTNQLELFNEFSGVKVKIYAPSGFPFYEMREFLFGKGSREVTDFSVARGGSRKADGGEGNRVECEFYPDGDVFDDGNVKLTSIPTKHFRDSHAFLVEAEGKRILFTGDLRHDLIVVSKKFVIQKHVCALTHGSRCLFHSHGGGFFLQMHGVCSYGDRAGRNQYNFVAHVLYVREDPGQLFNGAKVAFPHLVRERGSAYFYDDSSLLHPVLCFSCLWFLVCFFQTAIAQQVCDSAVSGNLHLPLRTHECLGIFVSVGEIK